MGDESRVQQLVEEILDSQGAPEEVCADCPELLGEVRKRLEQALLVEAELTAMFPTPEPTTDDDTPAPRTPPAELPHIPGYHVEAVLGRGGMGIVYKARHLRLNRPVAIKMLLAGAYAGLQERERFLREAEAVAGLRHPNLVQVHDMGDHNGRPYFTMEYVEGGSLAQKLVGTPQPAHQAAALLTTLAEAVQVAHHGGIVHRDLKPANILLAPNPKSETRNPKQIRSTKEENPKPVSDLGHSDLGIVSDFEFRISDFLPKIADFGLARNFDSGPALTRTGDRMGTPSYMAPEQALGKARAIGPSVDIYALGAILYELLTGRPPFRGETVAETELQVIYQDPVPPSRLNARVPRDLETICLKCLEKYPDQRYATAAALAEDLQRFQRHEPITARPAGLLERTGKWIRRHPTQSATLAASLLFALMVIAAGVWFVVQQAHQRDAVESDLKKLAEMQESARWTEARTALDRAEARLDGGGPGDLRRRLGQARHDLDLVVQLDDIHLNRVSSVEEEDFNTMPADADRDYEAAFRDAGLGQVNDDPADVAARVRASAVHEALVAALDDWAVSVSDPARRRWLLEVVRQADPDPEGWRARDPRAWEDGVALAELAETAPVAGPSVQLLLALGERLHAMGGDATGFLRRVQREHPADFWANFTLGNALKYRNSGEAISYFRVALAIRPGAAIASIDLADVLKFQGWLDEALDYYRKALAIDPRDAKAQAGLGSLLKDMGRLDDALAYFRQAVRDDSHNVWAHVNLGKALKLTGRLDEAIAHYQQALDMDPKNHAAHDGLRSVLMRQGQAKEVQVAWRKALDADPPEHEAWLGYAELCLFLGQEEEYHRARRELLARFGASTDPFVAERIGRACLLLPAPEAELRQAAALTERAVAAGRSKPDWAYPYFLFAQALAAYRQGWLDSAIAVLQGDASFVPGPNPRLVLAMALHCRGRRAEARHTLAAAVAAFDWRAPQADNPRTWMCHLLRRQAETLILPNLPAFLDGKYQPQDNDERLAFLGVCQFTNRTRALARLYADAFAASPSLADDLVAGQRYNAARAAVLAGCGEPGVAATGVLSEAERASWRKQARQWLRADLAASTKMMNSDSRADRDLAKKMLTRWQVDPDLDGVRQRNALERFSKDEQEECLALWKEVAAVLSRGQK